MEPSKSRGAQFQDDVDRLLEGDEEQEETGDKDDEGA